MTSGPATQIRLCSLCETSSHSVRLYGSLAKVPFRAPAPFPSVGGAAPGLIPGIGWSDH